MDFLVCLVLGLLFFFKFWVTFFVGGARRRGREKSTVEINISLS